MKKQNLLLIILIVLTILSCSSNNNSNGLNNDPIENIISKMTVSSYDNTLLKSSCTYILQNNKIINATCMDVLDGQISEETTITYNYSNNKLSSIEYFKNNQLYLVKEYNYNLDNDDLVQHKEYSVNSGNLFDYYKTEYTYNNSQIFSNRYTSDDNSAYQLIESNTIIMDNDQNITSSEITFSENSNLYTTAMTYDNNNNLLSKYFGDIELYDYSYTDVINPKSIIMNNTYGRQVLSLEYLGANITFSSPLALSPNVLLNASQDGNTSNIYTYEISYEANENNYATKIQTSGTYEYTEITEFTFE